MGRFSEISPAVAQVKDLFSWERRSFERKLFILVDPVSWDGISKSWKVRYYPAALMIDPLPRQGLIMDCNSLFGWIVIIIDYMPLPSPPLDLIISYNASPPLLGNNNAFEYSP